MEQEIRNEIDIRFKDITSLRNTLETLETEHPEIERILWSNNIDFGADHIDPAKSSIFKAWRSIREEIASERYEIQHLLKQLVRSGSITYAEWLTEVTRFNCDPYLPRLSIIEGSSVSIGLELEDDGRFRFYGYPLRSCEKSDKDYLTKEKAQSLSKLFARLAEEL